MAWWKALVFFFFLFWSNTHKMRLLTINIQFGLLFVLVVYVGTIFILHLSTLNSNGFIWIETRNPMESIESSTNRPRALLFASSYCKHSIQRCTKFNNNTTTISSWTKIKWTVISFELNIQRYVRAFIKFLTQTMTKTKKKQKK